jgi:hypothetical protein
MHPRFSVWRVLVGIIVGMGFAASVIWDDESHSLSLLTAGGALGAFVVWIAVRATNRREPWAKWTLAALVALPVLYVASLFPISWMIQRDMLDKKDAPGKIMVIYMAPVKWLGNNGPEWVGGFLNWIGSVTEPAD